MGGELTGVWSWYECHGSECWCSLSASRVFASMISELVPYIFPLNNTQSTQVFGTVQEHFMGIFFLIPDFVRGNSIPELMLMLANRDHSGLAKVSLDRINDFLYKVCLFLCYFLNSSYLVIDRPSSWTNSLRKPKIPRQLRLHLTSLSVKPLSPGRRMHQ